MTDQNKENESKELRPGDFVEHEDGRVEQALFNFSTGMQTPRWVLMNVRTGECSIVMGQLFGCVKIDGEDIPTIADRLKTFNLEEHEAIERLRAACPLGDSRKPYQIAQHFIDRTAWLDENLERAKRRNNLLCAEQDQLREALGIDVTVDLVDEVRRLKRELKDAHNTIDEQTQEVARAHKILSAAGARGDTPIRQIENLVEERDDWKGLVNEIREAFDVTDEDQHIYLVGEVHRLKEAQEEAVPEQVMALQATIKRSDEQWNKVCEALGLPDMGRMDEAQVAERVRQFAADTANALKVTEAKVEAFRAMNSIIQDNWDLHMPMDGNPVHMLKHLMDELQDLRLAYGAYLGEAMVEQDPEPRRDAKHGEHENTEHVSKELAQTLANGLVSKENRIKEMDEALETALMEIAKQAQVIDELRSQLKVAQRQCESQRVARRAAEGKIDGLERAIEIIGGRR